MDHDLFALIDGYIERLFLPDDAAMAGTVRTSLDADMPQIHVSPVQGKYLHLLARLCGAHRILEVGTLAGYSTIWLARALPADGKLVTLEHSQKHADIAAGNLAAAGVSDRVTIRVGAALETLPRLVDEPPFDMVFIDANKDDYPAYLDWSVALTRPGGLILADNVVRAGRVLSPAEQDIASQGANAFNQALANHPRLDAVINQMVGAKGHDGLALAIVKDPAA